MRSWVTPAALLGAQSGTDLVRVIERLQAHSAQLEAEVKRLPVGDGQGPRRFARRAGACARATSRW